jgi:aryl-phospho-beta-D-glucosidase BglC (GH1 family)
MFSSKTYVFVDHITKAFVTKHLWIIYVSWSLITVTSLESRTPTDMISSVFQATFGTDLHFLWLWALGLGRPIVSGENTENV